MHPVLLLCVAFWILGPSLVRADPTRIVLIAGDKSHPPAMHEYLKTVRLLKVLLEEAPGIGEIDVDIVYDGWPADQSIFDDADLLFFTSDGQDGHLGRAVPYQLPERMATMRRLMARGVGIGVFHFSTFAPDSLAPEVLAWTGGYFDWQNDAGERAWRSGITTVETDLTLPTPDHPIARGVRPFRLLDEYYYDIRFPEPRRGWAPILAAPALPGQHPDGEVVAWAVERPDGGHGFGTTTGHFYADWKHPDYRRLLLNAIVWAAGLEVPPGGVESRFYTDTEVTRRLFDAPSKGLVLAAPACRQQAQQTANLLAEPGLRWMDAAIDVNKLAEYDLRDYAFVALIACPEKPAPALQRASLEALTRHLQAGGGLLVLGAGFEPGTSAPEDTAAWNDILRSGPHHAGASVAYRAAPVDPPPTFLEEIAPFQASGAAPIAPPVGVQPLLISDAGAMAWSYTIQGRGRVVVSRFFGDASTAPFLRQVAGWLLEGKALWSGL